MPRKQYLRTSNPLTGTNLSSPPRGVVLPADWQGYLQAMPTVDVPQQLRNLQWVRQALDSNTVDTLFTPKANQKFVIVAAYLNLLDCSGAGAQVWVGDSFNSTPILYAGTLTATHVTEFLSFNLYPYGYTGGSFGSLIVGTISAALATGSVTCGVLFYTIPT